MNRTYPAFRQVSDRPNPMVPERRDRPKPRRLGVGSWVDFTFREDGTITPSNYRWHADSPHKKIFRGYVLKVK